MEALNNYLKQFPLYTSEVFQDILPYLSLKQLQPGEHWLDYGKVCREIGFIKSGLFRLYYLQDGKEITNCFCSEDNVITSYTSLISSTASEIAIQAIEPSELIVFSYDSLKKLYAKNIFWQQLGRMASESEFIRTECHQRFINNMSATERYQEILDKEPELATRVPLNYLASYMQIAPETLSRIRKKISDLT